MESLLVLAEASSMQRSKIKQDLFTFSDDQKRECKVTLLCNQQQSFLQAKLNLRTLSNTRIISTEHGNPQKNENYSYNLNNLKKRKSEEVNNISTIPVSEVPKKKKKKKKKKTFQDEIFNKMLITCKPYTLRALARETNSTEDTLQNLMLSLVDKNLVLKRDVSVGRKKPTVKTLYWANQDVNSSRELHIENVNQEIARLVQEELRNLQNQEGEKISQLSRLSKLPTNDELDSIITEKEKEIEEIERNTDAVKFRTKQEHVKLTSLGMNPSACNPRNYKIRINAQRQEWKNRKDKCVDFLGMLADAMDKNMKEVVKLLDIERDEDFEGVKIPAKYIIEPRK